MDVTWRWIFFYGFFLSSLWGGEAWEKLWRQGEKKGRVGVLIWSEREGVLFSRRAKELFIPASVMKILTGAAACEYLGLDYAFETKVLLTKDLVRGELLGNLWVLGGADPNLSGRFYSSPQEVLRLLAKKVRALGVKKIRGDLVLDDRLLDREWSHPDWLKEDLKRWYGARISALTLNDGCVDLWLKWRGKKLVLQSFPSTLGWIRFISQIRPGRLSLEWELKGERTVRLWGSLPREGAWLWIPVQEPVMFFGHAFKAALWKEGIPLLGKVRYPKEGEKPKEVIFSFSHRTSLQVSLAVMLKRSQNLHAELFLKLMGKKLYGKGSFSLGRKVLLKLLRDAGIEEKVVIRDGSGLSRRNRLSPYVIVSLLKWVRKRPYGEVFRRSLAVGGVDGTLRKRMRRPPLLGNVYGKTGTLRGVSTLAGYLYHPGKRCWYVFALFTEGMGRREGRAFQDTFLARVLK